MLNILEAIINIVSNERQLTQTNNQILYDKLEAGYKMIGNAVPVNFTYAIAQQIVADLGAMALTEGIRSLDNVVSSTTRGIAPQGEP